MTFTSRLETRCSNNNQANNPPPSGELEGAFLPQRLLHIRNDIVDIFDAD